MSMKIDYQFCPQCRRALAKTPAGDPHCDHCDITIYTDVAAAGSVCPIKDGKVLLGRRGIEPYQGDYDLIGGFMEPDETPAEAAVREAREETGLDINITEVLGMYPDRYGEDGGPLLGIVFIADAPEGTAHPNDDVAALEWVNIDDIPQEAFESGFKSTRQALHDLQAWYRSHSGSKA